MALVIKNPQDLKTYLETRRKLIEQEKALSDRRTTPEAHSVGMWERGAIAGLDSAIQAVDALIEYQTQIVKEGLEAIRSNVTLPFDGDTE